MEWRLCEGATVDAPSSEVSFLWGHTRRRSWLVASLHTNYCRSKWSWSALSARTVKRVEGTGSTERRGAIPKGTCPGGPREAARGASPLAMGRRSG
jgi:hypothetical protein